MSPWVTLVGVVGVGAVLSYASRGAGRWLASPCPDRSSRSCSYSSGRTNCLTCGGRVSSRLQKAASAIGALTVDRKITPLLRPGLTAKRLTSFPHETVAATEARGIAGSGKVYVLGDAGLIYPIWAAALLADQQLRLITVPSAAASCSSTGERSARSSPGRPTRSVLRWGTECSQDAARARLRGERYQFSHSVGQFDVLLPSRVTQPDWPYWTELLGDSLPLGRLPAATTAQTGNRCLSSSPDCAAYLRIGAEAVTEPTVKVLDVTTAAGTFAVSYEQRPGDGELYIPLGRLWFGPTTR